MGDIVGWGEVFVPDEDDSAALDVVLDTVARSFSSKTVPTFATVAALKAAGALLIAADANVRFMGQVENLGVLRYTGPDTLYEWVGNHVPVIYQFASGSAGGAFSGSTTYGQWNTANYSFTPTSSGWASITVDTDAYKTTAGFGFANAQVFLAVNGGSPVLIDAFNVIHESETRAWRRWANPVNQYLTGGGSALLTVKVASSSSAGAWGLSGLNWKVVQQ